MQRITYDAALLNSYRQEAYQLRIKLNSEKIRRQAAEQEADRLREALRRYGHAGEQ